MSKPSGTSHSKADLGDSSKWSFSELSLFGKTLKMLESDILDLYKFKGSIMEPMRELESNLLKGISWLYDLFHEA